MNNTLDKNSYPIEEYLLRKYKDELFQYKYIQIYISLEDYVNLCMLCKSSPFLVTENKEMGKFIETSNGTDTIGMLVCCKDRAKISFKIIEEDTNV